MGQVFALALTAAINPTLLSAVTFMLSRPHAGRLMLGYYVGAFVTSMTCGLLIVFALDGSSGATSTAEHTVNPLVDIVLGALVLGAAFVVGTGRAKRLKARRERRSHGQVTQKAPPRWQRALSSGSARVGFVVGLMLTLPGASYLAALSRIGQEDLSTPALVLTLLGFNTIMLLLLEIPLLGFAIAPERTNAMVNRFSVWLRRRGGHIALIAAVVIGAALVTRGVVSLLG
jgi:hypothetical protein